MKMRIYRSVLGTLLVLRILTGLGAALHAQSHRILVVDQTGLPLPGVTIEFFADGDLRKQLTTEPDGTFAVDPGDEALTIVARLDGFEPARVPVAGVDRIVLELARAAETTTVVAPAAVEASPTALTGSTLTQTTVTRLPSSHMHARESLPLLPAVIRGADGLMQLGGARAYQTPLTLDGFNVTDPSTGLSSLNLPAEAVLAVDALRDPMAITYGGLLGGMVRMESRAGGAMPAFGLQGFVPRPRFSSPGFGRLEGIFPRAHVAGKAAGGRVQFVLAGEYDYERIPVPQVTDRTGRDLIEESGIIFTRFDIQMSPRDSMTIDVFGFPTRTRSYGLSPRRAVAATVDVTGRDTFAGVTHRHVSDRAGVFTTRVGALGRTSASVPNGAGASVLTPAGWGGNWFSEWSRTATRYSAGFGWERSITIVESSHDLSIAGDVARADLNGQVTERMTRVFSTTGALVRQALFGPSTPVRAQDTVGSVALRDLWRAHERVQIESGIRVDTSALASSTLSARVGLRYTLDQSGQTTLKAGLGRFVGVVPLVAAAFAQYPVRTDTWFDEATGERTREIVFRPAASALALPRARTLTVGLERELFPGLDVQTIFTARESSRLPVVVVPDTSGPLRVESSGTSSYREVQFSGRRTLPKDQLIFASYVWSSAIGELNEVAMQTIESPLLEPGGRARTSNDARHRVLAWGTVNLPLRVVMSPAAEWHSGFTYSSRSTRYTYVGTPNSRTYPQFFSMDLVTYKTVTVHGFDVDLGVQVFNLTNHWNPRDVFPVVGEPGYGTFANSVGRIFRGYMLLKW